MAFRSMPCNKGLEGFKFLQNYKISTVVSDLLSS